MSLQGEGDQVWKRQVPKQYHTDYAPDKKPFFSE